MPCLTGVQVLPEVLEVSTAHPASGVTRHRTQHRPTRRGSREQPASDRREGKQCHDQASGQSNAATKPPTRSGLVLADDLHLLSSRRWITAAS